MAGDGRESGVSDREMGVAGDGCESGRSIWLVEAEGDEGLVLLNEAILSSATSESIRGAGESTGDGS